ncbi:hypothetical protein HDE78_003243 [Rhodanobacter sp. K2T2]|nr:hypothetical protein [Rhodanobacter sp. K2T2]
MHLGCQKLQPFSSWPWMDTYEMREPPVLARGYLYAAILALETKVLSKHRTCLRRRVARVYFAAFDLLFTQHH